MRGFELTLGSTQIFIETDRTRKTDKLASDILRKLLLPDSPDRRKELLYWLRKAECDLRTLPDGRSYYDIKGDCFHQIVFNGTEPGIKIINI